MKKRDNHGFTFIEILVSLVIIGALTGVMYVMINHLDIYSSHERLIVGTMLARELILSDRISEDNGEYNGFRFKRTLRETKYPGIYLYTVVVTSEKETIVMDRFVRR